MKVLIVNVSWCAESTGKIAYGFYKKLVENGHDVRLMYGMGDDNTEDAGVVRFVSRIEPKVHFRYNLITGYHGKFDIGGTRRLIKNIKEFKPDIIQLYNLHGYYLNEPKLFRYLAKARIPVVYGMLDEYPYLGYCCYAYDCDKFMRGCINCNLDFTNRYKKSLFFNRARETYIYKEKEYNSVEKIVFTGPKWVLERAEASSLLKGRELREIDEYIDCENTFVIKNTDALKQELGINDDKIVLLDVAPSTDDRKGIKYFVEMARRAEEEYPGKYIFLNVGYCGGFDDLPANYMTVGFVSDQNKLAEYYSLADAYVCTSKADTMPNACLDAMACGTPVIGFSITGIPYIADAPVGQFASPDGIDEIYKLAINVSKKNLELQKRCREYACERYSIDTYYKKQLDIYNELSKGM